MTDVDPTPNASAPVQLECGLVMPISALDGCTAEHWAQVKDFLTESVESIEEPSFSAKLVSEAADVGMILRRIVRNVYKSDIVVCDVSGKNANVMFELGMRLAFDKPVVIVKDDQTDYSFDTSIIEHLIYPRDLRYPRMVEFREQLKVKVRDTFKTTKQAGYHGFLKNFGTFTVARLQEKTGTPEEVLLEMMKELQKDMDALRKSFAAPVLIRNTPSASDTLARLAFSGTAVPNVHLQIGDAEQASQAVGAENLNSYALTRALRAMDKKTTGE